VRMTRERRLYAERSTRFQMFSDDFDSLSACTDR
jgi:hypothetical protein